MNVQRTVTETLQCGEKYQVIVQRHSSGVVQAVWLGFCDLYQNRWVKVSLPLGSLQGFRDSIGAMLEELGERDEK